MVECPSCKDNFYLVTAIKRDQSKYDYIESITKLLDSTIYECTSCGCTGFSRTKNPKYCGNCGNELN